MHHSKRWVYTYDGRLKRSSHRTMHDQLGDILHPDRLWDIGRYCADCRQGHRLYGYRFTCTGCKTREQHCRSVVRGRDGYKCAPRWFRNRIERQYRREAKALMSHGRYERLPTHERLNDAGWRWF